MQQEKVEFSGSKYISREPFSNRRLKKATKEEYRQIVSNYKDGVRKAKFDNDL